MRKIVRKEVFCQGIKPTVLALFLSFFISSCVKVPISAPRHEDNEKTMEKDEKRQTSSTSTPEREYNKKPAEPNAGHSQNQTASREVAFQEAVDHVINRVVRVSNRPDFDWKYEVIDDDHQINAFALPSGTIGIYTGILHIAETEAELAVILGHEVAHVVAGHGEKRVSSRERSDYLCGGGVLGVIRRRGLSVRSIVVSGIMLAACKFGVDVGLVKPFSRKQEAEADRMGLAYMARAGYDPREAINVWQKMAEFERRDKAPEFLLTHPHAETRIMNLQKYLPEALEIYERSYKASNYRITK